MIIVAIVPVVFALLGLLLFLLAPGKWSTVGLIMFAASFFVLMEIFAKHVMRLPG